MVDDVYSLQLQLQNLQHELQYLRNVKAVEVSRREHFEAQLQIVRQDLEKSHEEREYLNQKIKLNNSRIQELKLALQLNKNKTSTSSIYSNNKSNIAERYATDEEDGIEILAVKPNLSRNRDSDLIQSPTRTFNAPPVTVLGAESLSHTSGQQAEETFSGADSETNFCVADLALAEYNTDNEISTGNDLEAQKNPDETYGGKIDYVCELCGKHVQDLRNHVENDHNARSTSKNVWECLHCPKTYRASRSLKLHYRVAHCAVRFSCRMCSKGFMFPGNARRHEKRAHGYTDQPRKVLNKSRLLKKCFAKLGKNAPSIHNETL